MNPSHSLIGSWASESIVASTEDVAQCIWHVIDERTCVYEQQTDMGRLVAWFQYWTVTGAILRFPLSSGTRSLFKAAERIPIEFESNVLIMKGHKFKRTNGLPIPERFDLSPGERRDESGNPIPQNYISALQDYLSEPPTSESREP